MFCYDKVKPTTQLFNKDLLKYLLQPSTILKINIYT